MLSEIDLLLTKFENLEHHSNFFIRERIYKGDGNAHSGVIKLHHTLTEIKQNMMIDPIPDDFLVFNQEVIDKTLRKVDETLDLLTNLDTSSLQKEDIGRYYSILDLEISEVVNLIDSSHFFDLNSITTEDQKEQETRENLFEKLEDNITQILASTGWRRFEEKVRDSVGTNMILPIRKAGLRTAVDLTRNVQNLEFLQLLAILFTKTRSEAALNLEFLDSSIPFLHTICRIFSFTPENPFSVKVENNYVIADDVKVDLEHKVNTGKFLWLIRLHDTVLEETSEEEILQVFAEKLYTLSRDRKQEFLWTMARIARDETNQEIEDLSIKLANLSTILISMVYDLKSLGYSELSSQIKNLSDISALDAVTDLVEIYQSGIPNVDHMITALKKQIEHQKEFAYKIMEITEIQASFEKIVKFTDMDFPFTDETTVEEYLNAL